LKLLCTPLSEGDVETLKAGDYVWLSGLIVVARDQAHARMLSLLDEGKPLPVNLKGLVVYHAGPIALREGESWRVLSIGPTTSSRFEKQAVNLAAKTGVKMLVGKGGLSPRSAEVLRKAKAVYCAYPGGVGVLPAKSIVEVVEVHWLDLGVPEALWILKVEKLGPLLVAIDLHGGDLYRDVASKVKSNLEKINDELGLNF